MSDITKEIKELLANEPSTDNYTQYLYLHDKWSAKFIRAAREVIPIMEAEIKRLKVNSEKPCKMDCPSCGMRFEVVLRDE